MSGLDPCLKRELLFAKEDIVASQSMQIIVWDQSTLFTGIPFLFLLVQYCFFFSIKFCKVENFMKIKLYF